MRHLAGHPKRRSIPRSLPRSRLDARRDTHDRMVPDVPRNPSPLGRMSWRSRQAAVDHVARPRLPGPRQPRGGSRGGGDTSDRCRCARDRACSRGRHGRAGHHADGAGGLHRGDRGSHGAAPGPAGVADGRRGPLRGGRVLWRARVLVGDRSSAPRRAEGRAPRALHGAQWCGDGVPRLCGADALVRGRDRPGQTPGLVRLMAAPARDRVPRLAGRDVPAHPTGRHRHAERDRRGGRRRRRPSARWRKQRAPAPSVCAAEASSIPTSWAWCQG